MVSKSPPTEAQSASGTPQPPSGLGVFALFLWHLILGLQTKLGAATLSVMGDSYTRATLVPKIQAMLDPYLQLAKAEADAAAARKLIRDNEPTIKTFIQALIIALKALFGPKSPALLDFGLTPEKERAKMTPAQAVQRAERAKQTRAALGTMGPKQKKARQAQLKAQAPASAPSSNTSSAPAAPAAGTPEPSSK